MNVREAPYQQETQHVGRDKYLGEPGGADEGVALAVDPAYDAAEDHVDGGGEEGGPDEDEQGLQDVRALSVLGRLVRALDASNVAYGLTCWI